MVLEHQLDITIENLKAMPDGFADYYKERKSETCAGESRGKSKDKHSGRTLCEELINLNESALACIAAHQSDTRRAYEIAINLIEGDIRREKNGSIGDGSLYSLSRSYLLLDRPPVAVKVSVVLHKLLKELSERLSALGDIRKPVTDADQQWQSLQSKIESDLDYISFWDRTCMGVKLSTFIREEIERMRKIESPPVVSLVLAEFLDPANQPKLLNDYYYCLNYERRALVWRSDMQKLQEAILVSERNLKVWAYRWFEKSHMPEGYASLTPERKDELADEAAEEFMATLQQFPHWHRFFGRNEHQPEELRDCIRQTWTTLSYRSV